MNTCSCWHTQIVSQKVLLSTTATSGPEHANVPIRRRDTKGGVRCRRYSVCSSDRITAARIIAQLAKLTLLLFPLVARGESVHRRVQQVLVAAAIVGYGSLECNNITTYATSVTLLEGSDGSGIAMEDDARDAEHVQDLRQPEEGHTAQPGIHILEKNLPAYRVLQEGVNLYVRLMLLPS